MAHDPKFEQRIAASLESQGAQAEGKKMFGGVAFMVRGHMTVGITNKGDFMARFEPSRHEEISTWPGAKPMTFGKGNMRGFLFCDATAVGTKASLDKWVRLALEYNAAQLPKAAKPSTRNAAKKAAPKGSMKHR